MIGADALSGQLIDLFATLMLLVAFAMIAQRRVLTLIHLFAVQGATLVACTALVGYLTDQPHLYLSAGLTLALQLKQRFADLDILVLERRMHPVPVATHKVGESTVRHKARQPESSARWISSRVKPRSRWT